MLLNNLKEVLTSGEVAIMNTNGKMLDCCANGLQVNGLTAWLEVIKVVATDNHKILVMVKSYGDK